MANIGEAQITRFTRERLEAMKKFLPVRDAFRDHLQSQQQEHVEFTADTERLFKPITAATERVGTEVAKVGTDTAKIGTDTEKIAKSTKQVKKSLKTLPGDIVAAQPAPVTAQPESVDEQEQGGRKIYRPDEIFTETTLNEIKNKDNIDELARYAVDTFGNKERCVKSSYGKRIELDQWYKKCIAENIM